MLSVYEVFDLVFGTQWFSVTIYENKRIYVYWGKQFFVKLRAWFRPQVSYPTSFMIKSCYTMVVYMVPGIFPIFHTHNFCRLSNYYQGRWQNFFLNRYFQIKKFVEGWATVVPDSNFAKGIHIMIKKLYAININSHNKFI